MESNNIVTAKAEVEIYFAGQGWSWHVVSGSVGHLPFRTYAKTGKELVGICNQYEIKVLNPDALVPELANQILLK